MVECNYNLSFCCQKGWVGLTIVHISNEGYSGINPLYLGWRQCDPGFKKGTVVQTCWLLHYVVSGHGIFYIRDRKYRVGPGEIFVIPPLVPVDYHADQNDPWNYIWVGFSCDGPLPKELDDVVTCPGAQRIFQSMRIAERQTSGRSAYLCACLWELFAHLMEKDGTPPDAIDKAMGIIQSEYSEGITVSGIARRLGMDRSHFSTSFKSRVGVAPGIYLMDLRMKVAATLLAGGTSVAVTATSVGYSDIYVFSKMFKRHYGISPSQYAKLS